MDRQRQIDCCTVPISHCQHFEFAMERRTLSRRYRMIALAAISFHQIREVGSFKSHLWVDLQRRRETGFCICRSTPPERSELENLHNYSLRRKRQSRKKPSARRPKYYWNDPSHIQEELRLFWSDNGAEIPPNKPPPIPNEVLLIHFQRHDLRAAIHNRGGREAVSTLLGGAEIVPGRWADALESCEPLQQLIAKHPALSSELPPKIWKEQANDSSSARWMHRDDRRPKGYWSLQIIIRDLYMYTEEHRIKYGRPSVWMPRPSELAKGGREDLKQAFHRYGGTTRICKAAGMVPYQEWYYFEGQLELMMELRRYLDEYNNSDYSIFPCVSDVQRNGYTQLYSLIQYYGGRKFVAARFSMLVLPRFRNKFGDDNYDMNWGPFDLVFGVRLLQFIREDHLRRKPPMQNPVIAMPSKARLLADESEMGEWLDRKMHEYGGYENVARRLGLAFFSDERVK